MAGEWRLSPCDLMRGRRQVLWQVSAELPAGALTAVIGPNGAGKSSLLQILAGLAGDLNAVRTPEGRSLAALDRITRARKVAWTGAESNFAFAFDALSVVLMGRFPWHAGHPGAADRERAHAALAALNAEELAARSVHALSSGERQKLSLARVLASDAALLLFDEPTSNLDLDASARFLAELRRRAKDGSAIVACLHDLALVHRHADRVICLNKGRIVASGPTASTLTPELVRDVFGVEAKMLINAKGEKRLSLGD